MALGTLVIVFSEPEKSYIVKEITHGIIYGLILVLMRGRTSRADDELWFEEMDVQVKISNLSVLGIL